MTSLLNDNDGPNDIPHIVADSSCHIQQILISVIVMHSCPFRTQSNAQGTSAAGSQAVDNSIEDLLRVEWTFPI